MAYPIQALPHLLWPLLAIMLSIITSRANAIFIFIFVFRYLRLLVHIVSFYFIYKPTPIPQDPTLYPSDCTIVIPTVDPKNEGFSKCLTTVLAKRPGAMIIVTVGETKAHLIKSIIPPLYKDGLSTEVFITHIDAPNKRRQVCAALPLVKTKIIVLVDDHAYWPSDKFLTTMLAPFEDSQVGAVGTNKRVLRNSSGWTWRSICNFWAAIYLERHNFETCATNAIDGGVFVVSGRTSAYRTSILQDPSFISSFAEERCFFKMVGPIHPDDDNFITRRVVKKRWEVKIQYDENATMETDLGDPTKFFRQCLRWARTTWRSNSCSLFTDRVVWKTQPWCVYAVFWTSFFNFALFYDWGLVFTISRTTFGRTWKSFFAMVLWIIVSKMVKVVPHFIRCPQDLILIPAQIFMAYWHSLIKLYALLTFWNVHWEGRDLAAVEK